MDEMDGVDEIDGHGRGGFRGQNPLGRLAGFTAALGSGFVSPLPGLLFSFTSSHPCGFGR